MKTDHLKKCIIETSVSAAKTCTRVKIPEFDIDVLVLRVASQQGTEANT